ncbi:MULTISPECIES: TRAP transporter substrate-binding protein [unclassified Halomonas]|uniref:TRAP transporter substrate-binding protein n=1 Tax=unclassified Halomonas TaxID=2609666 RepID=UPI002579B3D4|nr:TRAP transporter substrate-binding protein [Halomonas sp.]MCJ8284437.1 TRAP transporter substrate-binding protein [Halomonas sp.]NQY69491.1 TRAP transporter substrate-binding protein [Halomonas sp.]
MKHSCTALSVLLAATLVTHAEARELRLGHASTESNPRHDAALYFAKRVEELSDGELTVSVNGNAQLGDDVEMMTGLRLGTIDLSISSQGALASVVEESTLIGLPFLFEDSQAAWTVLDGDVGETLSQKASDNGIVVLGFWDNGIRLITNSVRPVVEPQDLAGLKIRIPQDPMASDIFSALGANPVPIPFAETYVALQQGVADGQENPAVNIHSQKFHEVQDYLSLSHHKYEFLPLLASQVTWGSLTEAQQQVLRQAGRESTDFQRNDAYQANQDRLIEIEASGTEISEVNTEAFQAAVAPVYDKWRKEYPEFVSQLSAAAKQASE